MTGISVHGSGPSGSIKGRELLYQLSPPLISLFAAWDDTESPSI
jgi:hypothetical protein